MLVEKLFQIDGGKEYKGFSQGQYWNGFECPFFTLEVAQEIAKDMNAVTTEEKLVYDEAQDTFIYQVDYYPEDEWEKFEATMIEGKKLYGVGSFSWCWDGELIKS
ncbi:hypothetical protein [Burkholderia contaminans]|uniref:hypothetical protein n=1 Tax=Burkholderia contaminans TaxID=488447 RepID=UPI001589C547|nr:hypothetical protein [Burkholderia contaminans]